MMKDTKTEKDKLHRYLDDLYTREEASQLLQSIKEAENQDLLDELAAEVWEESGNLQPATDLEREKYGATDKPCGEGVRMLTQNCC